MSVGPHVVSAHARVPLGAYPAEASLDRRPSESLAFPHHPKLFSKAGVSSCPPLAVSKSACELFNFFGHLACKQRIIDKSWSCEGFREPFSDD